jgi:Predicted membrane protein (DUF2306)
MSHTGYPKPHHSWGLSPPGTRWGNGRTAAGSTVISAIDRRSSAAARVRFRRPVLIFIGVLIGIVLTSYGFRIATDAPFLLTGTDPEPEDFEARYVAHPWLAYLHMTPGVLYLLGAPLQLSERFRTKHYTAHRRLGRVLATAALVSASLALIFGLQFPWGGTPEGIATAVFGLWPRATQNR